MTNDSPAVILYDENGNRVGVSNRPIYTATIPSQTSAFGSIRVAPPFTLLDLINKYEIDTSIYGTQIIGSATITHVPDESAIKLSTTSASNDLAVVRTHTFFRYQAGKGMYIKQSIYLGDAGQTDQIKRWGFYDGYNGLFWELNETNFRVVRRTSTSGGTVDNAIDQSSWNVDTMDGYGDSGITLDVTKGNIYEIQFAWLGVGLVRFLINGILVHELHNENTISAPYMGTAQLPLQWEIINSAATTASDLTFICASVIVEGGSSPPGTSYGISNPSDVTITNTEVPLISIRLKYFYNGIVNRMLLLPLFASIITDGGRAKFSIIMNPSLSGALFVSVSSTSGVEYDESATSFTGGQLLFQGFLAEAQDNHFIDLSSLFSGAGRDMRLDAFGTLSDILTITAKKDSVGNTLMRALLNWREVR